MDMIESTYIEKKSPHSAGSDFAALRTEGIRLLQELCGRFWTDYNLHDPGVTILEQLCYALTDLMYRSEFDVADYLTGQNGRIDFEKQALVQPQDIFPSQAITLNDYRALIYNALPEADNVWVLPSRDNGSVKDGGQPRGLYQVYVKLKETADMPGNDDGRKRIDDRIDDKVREIYAANRNLGEDIKEVVVVGNTYYRLRGTIEIDGPRDPSDILAEIYYKSSRHIAPGLRIQSFQEMLGLAKSLEEIFTGPITDHGCVDRATLERQRRSVSIAELIGIIGEIEGVGYVDDLWFADEGQNTERKIKSIQLPASFESVPCLRFPRNDAEMEIELCKNGRTHQTSLKQVRVEYNRLRFENETRRHNRQDFADVYTAPQGKYMNLSPYYSIQNHFPAIYGINRFGVPESQPPARKAQAKQLKAYLLVFEQLMANFLAGLPQIAGLFSVDENLDQSYFHQQLDDNNIAGAAGLWRRPDQLRSNAARIVRRHDRFSDRRNRFLDYLLALYGERFAQSSLRRFHYCDTAEALEHELIHNKIQLLRHIAEISRKRALAFNYRRASWNTDNISSLKQKVGLLLGWRHHRNRSLTVSSLRKGLKVVSDAAYKNLKVGTLELQLFTLDDIAASAKQKFETVPTNGAGEAVSLKKIRRDFDRLVPFKNNLITESLMRHGIDISRYRLGSLTAGKNYQIVFNPNDDGRWWYLGSYPDRQKALDSINRLRRFLLHLNLESEGLHIVEHILLRPAGRSGYDRLQLPDGSEFYDFKISVVLPSWTARCQDENFRLLAEETVRLNCPAHILPQFYWLDFNTMFDFEAHYKNWLEKKSAPETESRELNAAAKTLIAFLIKHHHPDKPELKI
jgi:hypothetical protein